MFRKLIFFFPLQLLLVNLKRNHLLLLLWIILFGFVSKSIAGKYGIYSLFLAPEYLHTVSIWSYAIVGFAIGGFVMVFNISCYIINSKRFPFIAALKRPFVRFSINNSLLPLTFIIYYITQVIQYHIESEESPPLQIILYVLAILIGYTVNILSSLYYFLSTNKNIFKILGIAANLDEENLANSLFTKKESIYKLLYSKDKWHVEIYLHTPFKLKAARNIEHYDKKMLQSVISQNHLNASIFELLIFTSLIVLGLFSENPIFIIPAAASIILFFTIVFILMSAFYTWLKQWSIIVFIAIFFIVNYLSKNENFTSSNMAYGLNYTTESVVYSINSLNELRNNKEVILNDRNNALSILGNWKLKNKNSNKPKIVFINCSGGGSRAMIWTFYMLQQSDSLTNGQLFNQAHLITGSSGGMIGAAYYRELALQKETLNHSLYSTHYINNVSKDLLNPIAFSIATNDFFFRFKTFKDGNYIYKKDRGFSFEKQLLQNTDNALNKRLRDYTDPEFNAKIPMLILTPTVINDGRRMLISSQPLSFLTSSSSTQQLTNTSIIENFEFTRLFKNQDANNLKYTSALRMSATFPIIMPRVSLPTEPQITVMDAGMRDNLGKFTTYKYINTFKKWINENTSGIIIVSIRDKKKHLPVNTKSISSITETFISPVGSLYDNLFPIQDYNTEEMLNFLDNSIQQPIDVIDFELDNNGNEISLSWHLTTKEKEKILNSIHSKKNQESLCKLIELLN